MYLAYLKMPKWLGFLFILEGRWIRVRPSGATAPAQSITVHEEKLEQLTLRSKAGGQPVNFLHSLTQERVNYHGAGVLRAQEL